MSWAQKKCIFFSSKIFPPGTQKWYRSVSLVLEAAFCIAVCPASTALHCTESHCGWGEHCAATALAETLQDCKRSHLHQGSSPPTTCSCDLCARQGRDPEASAGEHRLSITRASYCWEGWAAAWQQLQPSFSSERVINSCCAGRKVVASLRNSCWCTAVFTVLCHWGMGLTAFEDLRNQQDLGARSLFLAEKVPNKHLLLLNLELSCCPPFSRCGSSPFFRAAASTLWSCWAQQSPSWALNCKLALYKDKNSKARITLTPK